MGLAWHLGEVNRNGLSWNGEADDRQFRAVTSAAIYNIQAYIPLLPTMRRIGHRIVEIDVPRFGAYVFLRFDRDVDPWGDMVRPNYGISHFRRLLCNGCGLPIIVPDSAIAAVRAYRPAPVTLPQNRRYLPGEPVILNLKGIRKAAVFVEYCGRRPMVRTWIFGFERITEVASAEIEPLELEDAAALGALLTGNPA